MPVTRFAPSPTGEMHLGHAYAAWVAWDKAAVARGGTFLLRFEDIDITRCRPPYEEGIRQDLAWLGFTWPEPALRQSEHFPRYAAALDRLRALDLVYPCFCTRAQIQQELAQLPAAPHGHDGPHYPGTCRSLSAAEREDRLTSGAAFSWRFDSTQACQRLSRDIVWTDERFGTFPADPTVLGDVILARKDIPTSYHIAVVVDDAYQGITLVTRGEDLLPSTHLHRALQHFLQLPVPQWHHHALITDAEGRRLAKRDHATTLSSLRSAGTSAPEVMRMAFARALGAC